MPERQTITIPVPLVAPMGIPVDTPEAVQEVWDAFVKPEQESNMPQSVEMRVLMAILRAVYAGLSDATPSDTTEELRMTTNPYAEAVEAAARRHAAIQYRSVEKWDDLPAVDQEAMGRFVAPLVAAAVGPLLAPLRAALESLPIQEDFQDDDGNGMPVHFAGSGMALYPADYVHALDGFAASVEQALDAIEAGATSEGGRS